MLWREKYRASCRSDSRNQVSAVQDTRAKVGQPEIGIVLAKNAPAVSNSHKMSILFRKKLQTHYGLVRNVYGVTSM